MPSSRTPSWCLGSSVPWSCKPGRRGRRDGAGGGGAWRGEAGRPKIGKGCSQHRCSLSEQVPRRNDFLDAGIRTFQGP